MADNGWVADPNWKPDEERTWAQTLAAPFAALYSDPKAKLKENAQTIDDAVRATANAVTFGGADRLAGYAGGEGTDAEVKKSEAARERSPYASIGGDVAGAALLPGFGAEALAARYGGGAAARALGYGVTGAATGAAQGAGNTYTGNLPDYVNNALYGGALGGAFGAAGGAAFGRRPDRPRAETPDAAQLWGSKTHSYDVLNQHPPLYNADALARHADPVETVLRDRRFSPERSPQSFQAVDEMRGAPSAFPYGRNAPVAPSDIDYIRKGVTGDAIAGATPTEQASARLVRRSLDDFIRQPPAGAVLPGLEREAQQAAATANRAHGDYGAYKRTQALEEMIANARRDAGATASGLNLQNRMLQPVRSFIKEKGGESTASRMGFSAPEIAALDRYVGGGPVRNGMRYLDRVLGGGGGLGALGAGGVIGSVGGQYFKDNPQAGTAIGIAAPAAGLALRAIGNRRAVRDLRGITDMVAQRSPLYDYRTMRGGTIPGGGSSLAAKTARDAVALEILKQNQGESSSSTDWK